MAEGLLLRRDIQQIAADFAQWSAAYDVVLTPTVAKLPLATGEFQPKAVAALALRLLGRLGAGRALIMLGTLNRLAEDTFDVIPTTPLFNMPGQAAMSVPLYWSKAGLPIGMHFSAKVGDEGLLLRLAAQLEAASPWADRRPPL